MAGNSWVYGGAPYHQAASGGRRLLGICMSGTVKGRAIRIDDHPCGDPSPPDLPEDPLHAPPLGFPLNIADA
jgi:hypothetical protein